MDYYINKNIKVTKRVFPEQDRYHYYRYDMNENPEGLPVEFVNSVLKEITPEFLSIYPEQDRFLNKYAKYIGARYENVLATNGSDMAIRYILETFGEEGKEVVTVSPSFEMYWVNCSLLGLKHVPVSYNEDLTIDVNKIIDAINVDTRIVVLLNPNNPLGNVYSEEELKAILSKTKSVGAILVIDEAYHYFYDKTFLRYALSEENVIVLRTFSKLMSLAACRIGIIISNPQIINYIKTLRLTFDVNAIALLFAEKIIDNPQLIDRLIQIEKEGKEYFVNNLKYRHYDFIICKGNFILVRTKSNPLIVAERLKTEKHILVHPYNNSLLKGYIRVSTGSVAAMKIFADSFFDIDS